jgi:hypothetical protein
MGHKNNKVWQKPYTCQTNYCCQILCGLQPNSSFILMAYLYLKLHRTLKPELNQFDAGSKQLPPTRMSPWGHDKYHIIQPVKPHKSRKPSATISASHTHGEPSNVAGIRAAVQSRSSSQREDETRRASGERPETRRHATCASRRRSEKPTRVFAVAKWSSRL